MMAGVVALAAASAGVAGVAGGAGVGAASAAGLSTPSMSITASPATSVGLQVFANVNLSGGSSPTGSVTFRLFGPSDPSCVSAIFTSTVPAGPSVNSNRYTTPTAGTYRWQATYNGDANNAVVGPTLCSEPSAAVIVSKYSPSLSVTAPAPAGGMIHASVNLYGYGPTGSLSVFLTPPNDTFCSGPPVFTATVPVNGSGTYSLPATRPRFPALQVAGQLQRRRQQPRRRRSRPA